MVSGIGPRGISCDDRWFVVSVFLSRGWWGFSRGDLLVV